MASRSAPGSSRAPSESFETGLILRLQSRFIFGNKGADLIGHVQKLQPLLFNNKITGKRPIP